MDENDGIERTDPAEGRRGSKIYQARHQKENDTSSNGSNSNSREAGRNELTVKLWFGDAIAVGVQVTAFL